MISVQRALHRLSVMATVIFFSVLLTSSSFAQMASPNEFIEASPKQLLVGDRVDITLKVYTHQKEPITIDHKVSLQIRDQKIGQECKTTDDTLQGDGIIKGYCTSATQAGKMEIWAKTETNEWGSFEINGIVYTRMLSSKYIAEFRDPQEVCAGGSIAPNSVVLLKQNDVAAKVEWQHVENFVGSYEVMYGTAYGEYPHKRQTTEKSIIVDGLDPRQTYFFSVRAVSICKWTAASAVFQYVPLTGSVSAAKQLASPTASPRPKPLLPKESVVDVQSATSSSTAAATMSPTYSETSPTAMPADVPSQQQKESIPSKIIRAITSFFRKLKFWE